MSIGFYHHGPVPDAGVAEAILASGERVRGRNALHFRAHETENFTTVVVDEGENAEAIRTAYDGHAKVLTVSEFLKQEPRSTPSVASPVFDPDKPPFQGSRGSQPPKRGRK